MFQDITRGIFSYSSSSAERLSGSTLMSLSDSSVSYGATIKVDLCCMNNDEQLALFLD